MKSMNKVDRKNLVRATALNDGVDCGRTQRANCSRSNRFDGDNSLLFYRSSSFITKRSLQFRCLRNEWEHKTCREKRPPFPPSHPNKDSNSGVSDNANNDSVNADEHIILFDNRDDDVLRLPQEDNRSQDEQSPQNQQNFYATSCGEEAGAGDYTNTTSDTTFNSSFSNASGTTLASLDSEHENITQSSSEGMDGTFQSLTLQQLIAVAVVGQEVGAGEEVGGGKVLQGTIENPLTKLMNNWNFEELDKVGVELTQQQHHKPQKQRKQRRRRQQQKITVDIQKRSKRRSLLQRTSQSPRQDSFSSKGDSHRPKPATMNGRRFSVEEMDKVGVELVQQQQNKKRKNSGRFKIKRKTGRSINTTR